jgi:hypothetical protein
MFGDLLSALRPAEVLHHHRVAETRLKKREIAFAPRLDTNPRPVREVDLDAHTSHAMSLDAGTVLISVRVLRARRARPGRS